MEPMRYMDVGTGTPVVLLHAFPLDSRMWDAARSALAARARLITPDQRGFGGTPLSGAPDLALAAADVVALLDRLDLRDVVLGGCSMGGYVAMAVLRAAPERVAGLVLVDTKATADTDAARENRRAVAARAEAEGVAFLAESTPGTLLGPSPSADVVRTVRELVAAQSPAAVAWAQRAMAARPDSTDTLRGLDVPALVLRGVEDGVVTAADAAHLLGLLPRAELVELPDVGHLPPLEAPDEFAAAVLSWLR
jgi:pimeloyl-ACP methyl ester carboxylesterase